MDEQFSDSEVVLEEDVWEVEDIDEGRPPEDGKTHPWKHEPHFIVHLTTYRFAGGNGRYSIG